jgi:hypothetical protein
LLRDNNAYIAIYTGRNSAGTLAVGLASSVDGTTWLRQSTPVMQPTGAAWDGSVVASGPVQRDGAVLQMLYHGASQSQESDGISSSADGTAWPHAPSPILMQGQVPACATIYEGGLVVSSPGHYVALLRALDANRNMASSCVLTSNNGGTTWQAAPSSLGPTIQQGSLILEGTVYKTWFHAAAGQWGYATSTDAASWTVSSKALTVAPVSAAWNDQSGRYEAMSRNAMLTYDWVFRP